MGKKIRAFIAGFLILTGSQQMLAQSFPLHLDDSIPVEVNGAPLRNPWAGGINAPLFSEIDLNGDGIHDLFMFDMSNNRISTFINDGSAGMNAWHYAPEYISRFPQLNKWALLYDYNCDGKADLFTLSPGQNGIAVYRNDYTPATGLQFTLVTSELLETYFSSHTNVYAGTFSIPTFGDVDGDGDMDILGFNSGPDGRVQYHKNLSMEQYGTCDSLRFRLQENAWGHFKGPYGVAGTTAYPFCLNCRESHENPFANYDQSQAAVRDDAIWSIFMIDIDGDGDKDLLIGDSGANNTFLAVNGQTVHDSAVITSVDTLFPGYNVPAVFCTFHYHAYIDIDNDGLKDLLVSPSNDDNLHHNVWFYKNIGTNAAPVFSFQSETFLVDQMLDVGEGASPVLFDADCDGLQDLVVGNYGVFDCSFGGYVSGLHLYKNTGSLSSPAFQLTDSDYAGINAMNLSGPVYPAFGDLDGDGDKDMIIGESDGKLQYFTNTTGCPATFVLTGINYMGIDVGNTSIPQIIDLNRDGLLDIVIGNKNGRIKYFQNAGTATVPFFSATPTNDSLGGINVQTPGFVDGYAVPFFFDDHGHYKLLVSSMNGNVLLFDSIEGNLNGYFHLADTLISGSQGVSFGYNLAVSGGDLNNDSLFDILLGLYGGGVNIYMHDSAVGISELPDPSPVFTLIPNPSGDQCTIRILNQDSEKKYVIRVLNYLGENVFSKPLLSDRMEINTHDFPAGIYLVQLVATGHSAVQKLVVQH